MGNKVFIAKNMISPVDWLIGGFVEKDRELLYSVCIGLKVKEWF